MQTTTTHAPDSDRLLRQAVTAPRRSITLLFVCLIVGAAAMLALPLAVASAVDAAIAGEDILGGVVLFATIGLVLLVCEAVGEASVTYSGVKSTTWIRKRCVRHLLDIGYQGRRSPLGGNVVTSVVTDAAALGGATAGATAAIVGVVTSLAAIAATFVIDWRISLVMLAAVVLGVVRILLYVQQTTGIMAGYQETRGSIAARLLDAAQGAESIRAARTTEQEAARVLADMPHLAHDGRRFWNATARIIMDTSILQGIAQMAILALAGYGVLRGSVTPGQVAAAAAYTTIAFELFDQFPRLASIGEARAGAQRTGKILDQPAPPKGTASLIPDSGRVDLDEVTVHGDEDARLLDALTLTVPGGGKLAVVGTSGSGKSTLALVLAGLLRPDSGSVSLDGADLRDVTDVDRARTIACAFARPSFFGETVADAIRGGTDRDQAAIERAAKEAHIHEAILRLPHGYATPLADANLSGGESQRLGIARASVRAADVLVLDDASSSLDIVTESLVNDAVFVAGEGRTLVVCTHRAATARRCDSVVRLEKGRVAATGSGGTR